MNNLTYYEMLTIQQADRQFCLDIIVAIIAFISALLFYIDYRNRKNKERAEKSINIAEEFAQSVIPKLSMIYKVFEDSHLDSLLNKKKFIEFSSFDIDELNKLYSKKDILKYTSCLKKTADINVDNTSIKIEDLIVLTLNELEHMCMYISTQVADEKYIYNSLHQQFIKAVSLLYISISLINTDNKDKYYTNIIEVFNIWKNKYVKYENKEKKIKRQFEEREKRMKEKLKPTIKKIK